MIYVERGLGLKVSGSKVLNYNDLSIQQSCLALFCEKLLKTLSGIKILYQQYF